MTDQLEQALESFCAPVYGKTKRTPGTYLTVANYCRSNLARLLSEYHRVKNDQQLLREIRNDIDTYLRRYHKYCIEQRDHMGAHYYEKSANEPTDFEHLIPASRIRDLLLFGSITLDQALNAPTVRLSRSKHAQLSESGLGTSTPNMWLPFQRYSQFVAAEFFTHDGTRVDPATWTLADHYRYFQHLIISTGDQHE